MHIKANRDSKMAGLSAQERVIIDSFVASEKPTICASDLINDHSISRVEANSILSRLQKKGWLQRIKRGVYIAVPLGSSSSEPAIENAWPLAMELFKPCYISGWSAAEYWDFTEQIFNHIAVVTASFQRRNIQSYGGVTFRTRTIKLDRIFGTKNVWFGSRRVEVADPHRLVIDILDDPSFGGGGRHTLDVVSAYWKSKKHADPDRLLEYAIRFGRGTVFKRLGFLAEQFSSPTDQWLSDCRSRISTGISKLDPFGSEKGTIVTKWNLRINVPMNER